MVAAHIAVEDFGSEVLGKKVRVLFGDHKHKVDVASAIATQWFNEEHVGVVVDMPNSVVALATQKLAAARNRISITASAGSSDLTGKHCTHTGFHWAYDTYSNTVGMARAMVGFGLDTWYFITADYPFGWTLEQDASAAVQKAGGRVIGRSRHKRYLIEAILGLLIGLALSFWGWLYLYNKRRVLGATRSGASGCWAGWVCCCCA